MMGDMMKMKSAFAFYVLITCLFIIQGTARADDQAMEKCYGVAKAGLNDCDPAASTCDKAVMDADPNYWLYVPKGMCKKLVGGSLISGDATTGGTSTPIQSITLPVTKPESSAAPAPTTPAPAYIPGEPTPVPAVPATPATDPVTPSAPGATTTPVVP